MSALPPLPDPHALMMLALTAGALVLFSIERLQLAVTSLSLLTIIALTFALFPYPDVDPMMFFRGFAHEALIAVCALMTLGQGLVKTGALEPVGRVLGQLWGRMPALSLLITLVVGALLSAFINNTPIVVLLLPILISVCLRTNKSPSKILIPMGFATLVGGMATTIGTSTNLLVVGIAKDLGIAEFNMFSFALPAAIAAIIAIIYLWLIAPLLLPRRETALDTDSPRLFAARLLLGESSAAVGMTVAEARALADSDVNIRRILREDAMLMPLPDVILRPGDRLRLFDTPANLHAIASALGGELYAGGLRQDEQPVSATNPLSPGEQRLAELAVVQGSSLDGTSLAENQFIQRHRLVALALHRKGQNLWRANERLKDLTLQTGDVLLVQGHNDALRAMKQSTELLLLDHSITLPRTDKALPALIITAATILLAATGVLPIAIAAIAGTGLMLLTQCLTLGAAVRAISPAIYFVVAASLALGMALQATGATAYLTDLFLYATQGASPAIILSALMLLLAVLTNVVSNNAAAVIGTPIAVGIAQQLQLPAEAFILAVLFGANMSYATPMAYKTNLLVMNAGNYRFVDFVKVGGPLTIIMWLTLSWLLAFLYVW
ncbi:MAG TPA: SLC13 family permease [Gammaproteobacteria bacterium]|nr:SLC13 family permease [Gammaproteobacteria bacterium]